MATSFIHFGATPPSNPDASTLWLSNSLKHVMPSQTANKRTVVISANQAFEDTVCQEPSVVFYGGKYHMFYTGNVANTAQLGYATADFPTGPWTKHGPVLGMGLGGESQSCPHGFLYCEGDDMYYYYVNNSNEQIRVAHALKSAPTAWSYVGVVLSDARGSSGAWGNTCVIKEDGKYFMLIESSVGNNSWQTGLAVCDTATGLFVRDYAELNSLRNIKLATMATGNTKPSHGGCWLSKEADEFILYYHQSCISDGLGSALPSHGYRASSRDLIQWTLEDEARCFFHMESQVEVDQIADLHLCQGENEQWWMFYTAASNIDNVFYICCTPLMPQLMRYVGSGEWEYINAPEFKLPDFPAQNSSQTVKNKCTTPFNTTAGALTATLPRASVGNWCKVVNMGTGTNALTLAPQSTDTIVGGRTSLALGYSATLRCYKPGLWSVE